MEKQPYRTLLVALDRDSTLACQQMAVSAHRTAQWRERRCRYNYLQEAYWRPKNVTPQLPQMLVIQVQYDTIPLGGGWDSIFTWVPPNMRTYRLLGSPKLANVSNARKLKITEHEEDSAISQFANNDPVPTTFFLDFDHFNLASFLPLLSPSFGRLELTKSISAAVAL
ncbi:hypothetical protein L211DRAFT_131989 [Terfezia boudieri ATCC MYA-4762]|uniref:Uncharacterized protein n=1 Tax=Terfezia boudieri ATCC MYA-4762 TaxID=1051890 RepID=A0A3N4LPW4_9PEZI|nr:hypothetical protein L211DRAFT_131989 [Terfezia boudieri ATCC MYA-4762]